MTQVLSTTVLKGRAEDEGRVGVGVEEGGAFGEDGARRLLAVESLQERLVVQEVVLRGGAEHVQVDDPFGLGGEMRRGQGAELAAVALRGAKLLAEEGAEGEGSQPHGGGAEEGAAGEELLLELEGVHGAAS
ncbi:MAG: hypothetical protein RL095_499 [Verrucomicrobiota bacterium]